MNHRLKLWNGPQIGDWVWIVPGQHGCGLIAIKCSIVAIRDDDFIVVDEPISPDISIDEVFTDRLSAAYYLVTNGDIWNNPTLDEFREQRINFNNKVDSLFGYSNPMYGMLKNKKPGIEWFNWSMLNLKDVYAR